jgi:hypothetical protein
MMAEMKNKKTAPVDEPEEFEDEDLDLDDLDEDGDDDTEADWTQSCEVCGERPIVPVTGMCGPCTFGDADTVGGNW